jgi:hypothetical protein
LSKEYFESVDAEVCKLQTWSDQIDFGIIKCAECKNTTCDCVLLDGILIVPVLNFEVVEVDRDGDRKQKTFRRKFDGYYANIDRYQTEYQIADKIISDHYRKTGYSLARSEVLRKIRNGEITIDPYYQSS